jgi:GNAT superfamily N-acetyltransferase/predicted GNAT family acetyltransferase
MTGFRPISESDVSELLALWSACFPYDPLSEGLLREKIWEDPDFDPELNLLAVASGRPVAFASAVVRPQFAPRWGWIKLFTLPGGELAGMGSELLAEVERRLAARGASILQIFDSAPNYLVPGVDPRYTRFLSFLEEHGYRRFDDTANMETELQSRTFDTAEEEARLAREGTEVRRARAEDREAVRTALSRYFPQWVPEVERTFANEPISLHLAFRGSRVVAFAAYDANNLGTGWFGPMGTVPWLRGRGIGRVLYLRCLRDLQAQGYKKAIIPWVGPVSFYYRASGAVVTRTFWRYRKRAGY